MDNQTYQLELKQIVEFPRCRIYRDFIRSLVTNKSIRTNGGSFLFYYIVLCFLLYKYTDFDLDQPFQEQYEKNNQKLIASLKAMVP